MYFCSPLGNMKIFIFPGPHGQTPQNPKISFIKKFDRMKIMSYLCETNEMRVSQTPQVV